MTALAGAPTGDASSRPEPGRRPPLEMAASAVPRGLPPEAQVDQTPDPIPLLYGHGARGRAKIQETAWLYPGIPFAGRVPWGFLTMVRRGWCELRARLQHGLCPLCGGQLTDDVTLDHIIPLSRGGADAFEDTQAVHGACNREKGDS